MRVLVETITVRCDFCDELVLCADGTINLPYHTLTLKMSGKPKVLILDVCQNCANKSIKQLAILSLGHLN